MLDCVMKPDASALAKAIYALREGADLSQDQFAAEAGVSTMTLTRIESDKGRPTDKTLRKIARRFPAVDLATLFSLRDAAHPVTPPVTAVGQAEAPPVEMPTMPTLTNPRVLSLAFAFLAIEESNQPAAFEDMMATITKWQRRAGREEKARAEGDRRR